MTSSGSLSRIDFVFLKYLLTFANSTRSFSGANVSSFSNVFVDKA